MSSVWLLVFVITAILMVGAGIIMAWLLAPTSRNPQKLDPYECGIAATGWAWQQFNVGYYLFALLFLIFEVECVFMFPWAVVMRSLGVIAFVEILIFLFILVLGLAYAWKTKALEWE